MISIAMATYNGAGYVCEQMNSILAQTIRDFELVVCDDCSTDGTWNILKAYAENDPRIHLFRNEKNRGFKRNFEQALRLTHREYIALCDQDDVWTPDHLSTLYNRLNGGGKMLVCGESELTDDEGHDLGIPLRKLESYDRVANSDIDNAYTLLFFRSPFQGASMMIRREFLNRALPIPDGALFHDSWFAALACFHGGLEVIDSTVTMYRQHSGNASGTKIVRRKKFRTYIRHIRRAGYLRDRLAIAESIKSRVRVTDKARQTLLDMAILCHRRKSSLCGRLLNALFEFRHYRLIYSCRGLKIV